MKIETLFVLTCLIISQSEGGPAKDIRKVILQLLGKLDNFKLDSMDLGKFGKLVNFTIENLDSIELVRLNNKDQASNKILNLTLFLDFAVFSGDVNSTKTEIDEIGLKINGPCHISGAVTDISFTTKLKTSYRDNNTNIVDFSDVAITVNDVLLELFGSNTAVNPSKIPDWISAVVPKLIYDNKEDIIETANIILDNLL